MGPLAEGILIGAVAVLLILIAILVSALLKTLNQMREMAGRFGDQARLLQSGMEQRVERLQSRAEPILEETNKLIVTAQPAVEQLRALLAAATPVLIEARAVVEMAKETTLMTRSAAITLKTETESCMAAISATTEELTKMTREEAEGVRQIVANARERAERQVMRVDQIVTRTTDRLDETAAVVQRGVIQPVGEIAAVLAAVQRFLQVLFTQERKTIDQAYHDEEMFI